VVELRLLVGREERADRGALLRHDLLHLIAHRLEVVVLAAAATAALVPHLVAELLHVFLSRRVERLDLRALVVGEREDVLQRVGHGLTLTAAVPALAVAAAAAVAA